MMRSQTVAARDASMPLRITDRVRILPHSNREVLLGTAGVTILVAMKNQWGSVATLLDHDHVAGNFDVREHEIEYVQAMGPTATFCASFRKVDVVYISAALSCCAAQYLRRDLKRFSSNNSTIYTFSSLPSGTPLYRLLEIDWWLTQRATAATEAISRAVV